MRGFLNSVAFIAGLALLGMSSLSQAQEAKPPKKAQEKKAPTPSDKKGSEPKAKKPQDKKADSKPDKKSDGKKEDDKN